MLGFPTATEAKIEEKWWVLVSGMAILVTGGAGFIGSHLADHLLATDHAVTVLDDLSTGSRQNLKHLEGRGGFRFVQGSVLDADLVARLVAEVDATVHLAAAVGVPYIMAHPLSSLRTNILGTDIVLQAAATHRQPLLLASTSEVYGKSPDIPFRENDDQLMGSPQIKRWLYGQSKAACEFMAMAHWWESRLPVRIARFFNTVGPRQSARYGMVLPRFVQQALAHEPLTVFGDGQQTRCFTAVGDVVRAVVALIAAPETSGEAYNIGSTEPTTIEHLAIEVRRRTGSRSSIRKAPYDEAYGAGYEDMRHRVPDVSKLRDAIGFVPTTPLGAIIDEVIAFERSRVERGAPA